jgi:hypothetical protein
MADPTEFNTFGWASGNYDALVAPHLEYMRKNRWILTFGLPVGLTKGEAASLRLNCTKASRPQIEFEETEVKRLNGSVFLAGKPKFSEMSCSFYDSLKLRGGGLTIPDEAPSTSGVLERWRELIYQPNKGDAFGSAANYKGIAYLDMLEPMNLTPSSDDTGPTDFAPEPASSHVTQSWLIQGIFPRSIKYGDVDYSSSDVMEIEVGFRYDRAYRVKPESHADGPV